MRFFPYSPFSYVRSDFYVACVTDFVHCVVLVCGGSAGAAPFRATVPDSVPDNHLVAYLSVVRVSADGKSCSATAVAQLPTGEIVLTTARHCFGTRPRNGVRITYWRVPQESWSNSGRHCSYGGRQSASVDLRRAETASAAGKYWPADRAGDFGTIVARLDGIRDCSLVAVGDFRNQRGRKVFAVGCNAGAWPAKYSVGTIISARESATESTITASMTIYGGHSGGALFDSESGAMIGVTNWKPPTIALSARTFGKALEKFIIQNSK